MDSRNTQTTDHDDPELEDKPAARAILTGTGMFLPALIVFLIGLAVILYFVL